MVNNFVLTSENSYQFLDNNQCQFKSFSSEKLLFYKIFLNENNTDLLKIKNYLKNARPL
jgi:hypothetical protein